MKRYGRPLIGAAAFTLIVVGIRILFDPGQSDFDRIYPVTKISIAFTTMLVGFTTLILLDWLKARREKRRVASDAEPTDKIGN